MIIFLFSQGVGSTFHLRRRLLTDHPSFWFLSSDITRNFFSSGQRARNKSFSIKRKNICSSVSVSKVLKAVKYKYEEEMICKINIGSGCDLNWWGKLWATYGFVIIERQALAFEHCCNSHLEKDDDKDDHRHQDWCKSHIQKHHAWYIWRSWGRFWCSRPQTIDK